MSILNLTEDEKLLYEKYNKSFNTIVEEPAIIEEPIKVAEPVQPLTKPVEFTQEEINLYNKYHSAQKQELGEALPEPSLARQLKVGFAREPFLITNIFRTGRRAITAAFDPDRTYEEIRKEEEEKLRRQRDEKFPEFVGKEESAGVVAGRMLSALGDFTTFLLPWAKIYKFGKVASVGSVGAFGAADVAIRDEALYGEINPINVAIGFGAGVAIGGAMEAGMAYFNRASRGKVKTQTSDGKTVEKEVNIPGPTPNPVKVNTDEIPQIEKTAKEALLESEDAVNSIGNKFGQIEKLILEKEKLKKEIKKVAQERRLILKKKWSPEMKRLLNEEWNSYYKGVKTKNTELIDNLEKKISDLNNKIELQYFQIPSDFLKIYKDGMLAAFRNNVLNEGYARALVQEAVRPIFGGLVGGGVGAAFTGEGDDNTLMISFALLGAGFMQYQKVMQSKEFKLIPKTIKDAANNEFVTSYRRSFYNRLKSLTAGSHIQDLMGWSDEVAVQYGARMFPPQGGGVTTGRISTVRPVEEEAMSKLAYWNNRKMDLLAELDDELLILAGKISNQRNMPSTAKYSFLTKEDKLNPRFAEAERLSLDIDKYTDDFAEYVRVRGINFNEQDVYGLTQILKPITDATQVDEILSKLTIAYRIQNENIRKKLTPKQLKDKQFIEENFPTLNYKPEVLAEGHISTAGGFRRNSIFSDNDDKLFRTNDSAVPNFKSRDEDFVFQATKHFDKDRTLFDQEARASVADLFEQNPFNTLDRLINNTVKIAEFSKQFGSKGQLLKKIFSDINARYKKLADPENKFETVDSLFNARPGIRASADREKQKIKDSLEAYFGVYGINAMPKSDFMRTFTTFLQSGLAATRLTGVAVPSTGDLLQTITNSGYKAAYRGALSNIKLSRETLGLGKTKKQIEGKDAGFFDRFLGRNRSDTLVQRTLEDVLLLTDTTGMRKWQQRASNFTKDFFEAVQLGRITRIARTFAYDSGVYRVMDIADLISKGKTRTLLTSEKALLKEIDTFGLNMNNIRHISKFKTLEEAIEDPLARTLLNRAGIRAANRDAIIPMVGNRRLFTQTKNPYVKFLGTFLSWAQAKSSQTNALVSRIEEGDIALFLKILASIPLFMGVREAQVFLSPSEQYKEAVSDETTAQKVGEAMGYTGINTYGVEKIRSIIDSDKYGSDFIEQLSPALGYLNDIGDIAIKGGSDLIDDDDETNMEELTKWLKTIGKTIPIVEEVAPRIEKAIEGEAPKAQFTEGGLVKGTEDIPYTEENPADRINPLTGEPYSETSQGVLATLKDRQEDRVPKNNGGLSANNKKEKYKKIFNELPDSLKENNHIINVDGFDYVVNKKITAEDFQKNISDFTSPEGYVGYLESKMKRLLEKEESPLEKVGRDATNFLSFLTNALNPRTTIQDIRYINAPDFSKQEGNLLKNLQRRKKFGVGGFSTNVARILGILPNKVYRGGSSRIVDSPEGTESVFVATDKLHADSFADPDALAKVVVTEGKSLQVPKDKMDLHEIDISSAKNPYVLDEPSEAMKRQIERDLMDEQDDNKFNALMSLLHPEESDLRVASSSFYPINREIGKYLREKGYDIATDRKTIEEGFINNPSAELFLLKKFPVKVIDRIKLETQRVVDEIKGRTVSTVKVPTWFKETKVKTDVDPADAQKTQVGITSGTYKKVVPLLRAGNTLDFGAGLGKGAKILKADSYEPFPKKGFEPTFTETSVIPNSSYDNIVSLNVLNVVKPDVRNDIVLDIGRILKPKGIAIITTRGSDIFGNKNNITKGVLSDLEEGAIITSSGTYQKGFTNIELKDYVSKLLGDRFEVVNITGLGKAGIKVTKL